MDFAASKDKFLESWSAMASQWGISRSMSLVHASLLISPKASCADVLMDDLQLSRGSVNTNLRALMDWGLVHKKYLPGERKDHYYAEKDMWTIFRQILIHRKQKELKPLLDTLQTFSDVEEESEEAREFSTMIRQLRDITHKTDIVLDNIAQSEDNWFESPFFQMLK
jgi:DNA-binding transcriptional regulator GbsR (MarR family)